MLDIKGEGGLPVRDAEALEKVVRSVLRDQMIIVEIGSWKGLSTSILARTVVDYNGSVFAVDHWMGSEGVPHHEVAKVVDIFYVFKSNLISLGLWDVVYPLVMDSQTASKIFTDGIVDLVFIDADHRYESVRKDILSWLPKLRIGGILCGHDCEGYYGKYPKEVKEEIEKHLGDDCIPNIYHPGVFNVLREFSDKEYSVIPYSHYPEEVKKKIEAYMLGDYWTPNNHALCHPGVIKALYELFQDKYSIMPNSAIWYYVKGDHLPNANVNR
jgi:hypothetical protein